MRKSILSSALSMESAHAAGADNQTSLEASLALESAALSIEEAGNAVDMAGYEHTELENAATSLESIATAIESSMENDEAGMTQGEARGYSLAVEAVLGGALPNPVASMESFGGESERRHATELSMEDLKGTIQKIWDAIKRTVQKVITAVSDFFSKLFGGVEKAKKKAQSMKDKLKDMKDAEPKSKTFKSSGLSRIAIGGKVDSKTVAEGAKALVDLVKDSSQIADVYDDYLSSVVGYFKAKKEDVKDIIYAVEKANEDLRKVSVISKKPELPGGKVVLVADSEKSEKGLPTLISPEITDHPNAKSYKADKDGIDAMSVSQIDDLLDGVLAFLEGSEAAKKSKMAITKDQKDALAEADKFAQEVERGKLGFVEESWDRVKLRWVLSRAKGGMTSFISKFDRYVFSLARGYLSLAESAMDNLGKKDEKED
ncbi:MAG: hypothetical protein CL582_17745 [Alteromonadaceae bacterium]|nr:hypothetical protein [Alteromonadaceae bacterium]